MKSTQYTSDTRFRSIFNNAHVGILVVDSDRIWVDANQALCTMLGATHEQLVGRKHSSFIPANERDRYEKAISDLAGTGSWRGEFPLKRPDGSELILDIQASRIEDGMAMLVITDITAHRRTEEALRASEEKYRAVVDSQTEMLCRFERDGTILFVNQAYANTLGVPLDELLGRNIWNFISQEDHAGVNSLLDQLSPQQSQIAIENRFETKEGTRWTLWTNIGLRFGPNGNVLEAQSSGVDITDRKQTEEELSQARERLQLALSAGDVATWLWDVPNDRIYGDDNLKVFYNISDAEAMGGPSSAYTASFHPEDKDRITAILTNALEGGASGYEAEFRLTGSDGLTRWVLGRASIERDAEGRPIRVPGVLLNITERKKTEMELAQARQRLEVALAAGDVATWIWYVKEDIMYGDRNMSHFFDLAPDHVKGVPVGLYMNAIVDEDRERVFGEIAQAVQEEDGYTSEYRVRGAEGKIRWVLARGTIERDENGEAIRMPGVLLDITERKHAEEELVRSETRFKALFNTIDEAYALGEMILDENGDPYDYRFVEVNPSFGTMTGVPNAAGFTVRELRPDIEQHWIDRYARVGLHGETLRFEDGSEAFGRFWDVFAMPVEPRGRFILVFKDITHRRLKEVELRENDRRKDQFLATLAHELRNPLAPLKNGLQLLEIASDDQELLRTTREMMDRQVTHLVRLVDDLMDLSRISRGHIELRKKTIDLVDAVRLAVKAIEPQFKARGQKLELELPEGPVHVHGDETRISQIVGNLLSNANRYTPPDGLIKVGLETDAEAVVVWVKDNGIGIESDQIAKAFEMFTQLDHDDVLRGSGGLGIGLNIVQQLVEKHGGSISASSEGKGKGSTFEVRLPLVDATPENAGVAAAIEAGNSAAKRVMVVDDIRDVAVSMASLLQRLGHEVHICSNGEQAIKEAEQFRPDLILMDLGMPVMNGHEACRAIRGQEWGGNMRIVALSGWGQQSEVERSKESGFDQHFVKPISFEDLVGLVKA